MQCCATIIMSVLSINDDHVIQEVGREYDTE